MSLRIHNLSGLAISRKLADTSRVLSRTLTRLSSGSRVAFPEDDIASFSQSLRLTSELRGLTQGIRNLNEGAAAVQTALSAMESQRAILNKMRELALSVSSPSITQESLENLNQELNGLVADFNRITSATKHGSLALLDGSVNSLGLQTGSDSNSRIDLSLPEMSAASIFLKEVGTGHFSSAADTQIAANSTLNLMVDLTGDGRGDLLALTTKGLNVYENRGNGTFTLLETYNQGSATGPIRRSLVAGDVNNDGHEDVAVGGRIYLNNGSGSLSLASTGTWTEAALKDFNSDGNLDLVSLSGVLQVQLGNGDGTFQSASTYVMNSSPLALDTGDFNGDGFLDIIAAHQSGTSVVTRFGNGDGTFQGLQTLTTTNNIHLSLSVGDFNNDGMSDFVLSSLTFPNNFSVTRYLSNGNGTFASSTLWSFSGIVAPSSIAGDLNNDGNLDLAIVGASSSADGIHTMLGNGDGTFQSRVTVRTGSSPDYFALGDENGDGVLDLIGTDGSIQIYRGTSVTTSAVSDLVLSEANRQHVLQILDRALENLNEESSALSAQLHRLEFASSHNLLRSESLAEALSSVKDVDLALEMAEVTRLQILQQAQAASLAQANLQLSVVLELLRPLAK